MLKRKPSHTVVVVGSAIEGGWRDTVVGIVGIMGIVVSGEYNDASESKLNGRTSTTNQRVSVI
jgi:hypothetical protein